MNEDGVRGLIAEAVLRTDPATLRKALAAVLDECDDLHELASRYRELTEDQGLKNSEHGLIPAIRAAAAEHAVQALEEALITVLDLGSACARDGTEP